MQWGIDEVCNITLTISHHSESTGHPGESRDPLESPKAGSGK